MNPRSCQLCGKPISRLRVGGDADFCSREHRNQHRLRRGMDRLEEANKVTSLMRRRENPRHLSVERLMCNSALERRGFYEPRRRELKAAGATFAPVLQGPAPRVVSAVDRYAPPRAARLPGTQVSRPADTAGVHINGRGTLPLVPPRRQQLPVQISQAPLVALSCQRAARPASPRDFGMLRHGEIRVYLGAAPMSPGGREPRRPQAWDSQTHLRAIKSCALEGSALRVSIGIGFRVGAVNWRDFSSRPPAPAALAWPRTERQVPRQIHASTALYRTLEMGIWTVRACLPTVSNGKPPARVVFPGILAPPNRRPATGVQASQRSAGVSWRPSEPISRGVAVRPRPAGFARRNGSHLSLAVTPSSTHAVRQVAFAAFIPQEPVGCPRVDFEGTVAAAIVNSPGAALTAGEIAAPQATSPTPPAAAVRIEEHFGSGWDNWMGGTNGWRVDVAGVRTGPLALFVPTLELVDYDLDFLARIDTRSLTWVVRAAGLEEYLRCTLTAVGGGELEFSRCAVVGGAAEAPVTAAQRLPGKPRSAMTVRTRVSGHTFEVSVDGKPIETWNDHRFPRGGIGFSGAPDDRARLYWVRLSTQSSTKEQQKK